MLRSIHLSSLGFIVLFACGGAGAGPSNQAGANGPCNVVVGGPLIGLTSQPGLPPAPTGGVIADGIYDLVAMVDYGARKANGDPIIRLSLRFTTEERSINHAAGRIDMAGGGAPVEVCKAGRFATTGTVLRTVTEGEVSEKQFSVTPEGFTLAPGAKDSGATLVFRRR
jgi:hypothetical protein